MPEAHAETERRSWLSETDDLDNPVWSDKIIQEQRYFWRYWPHGVVYVQAPDYGAFSYALKYTLKDVKNPSAVNHLAMSKKPPLGAAHFVKMAKDYAAQRLKNRTRTRHGWNSLATRRAKAIRKASQGCDISGLHPVRLCAPQRPSRTLLICTTSDISTCLQQELKARALP